MKILVTGATGLIGSRVVETLQGHEVWAITRSRPETHTEVRWIEHNLGAPVLPEDLPREVDVVFHLAQSRNFRRFPQMANEVFSVNVASTQLLIDWAARGHAKTFVFASSGGVYGHGDEPFREDDPVQTRGRLSHYLATKRVAEELVDAYVDLLTVVTLRFFFVYGPGQQEQMLIPRLVSRVRAGQPLQLQGADGMRLNPIHVDDAARSVLSAANLGETTLVNVAGPQVLTMREIGREIGSSVGREPVFDIDADAAPRHMVGSIERMTKLLGPPTIAFNEGLRRMLDVAVG